MGNKYISLFSPIRLLCTCFLSYSRARVYVHYVCITTGKIPLSFFFSFKVKGKLSIFEKYLHSLNILNRNEFFPPPNQKCRYRWQSCLRGRSEAALLLRMRVPISPETWIFICFECCVLSGISLPRADPSSREDLSMCVCVCVCVHVCE